MATIGLREFWDSLDENQLINVLLVHKYELIQQLTDEKDKYLCVFTVCTIEEELNVLKSSKHAHHDSLTLNLSKDGIYDLAVLPSNAANDFGKESNELAQCFPGEFLVSKAAMDRVIRNLDPQHTLPPVNFSADKVCLRCLDMLTYPRPVRKFKLIVERQVMLSDLRNLLAADVGINEEELVLMIRGKEVARDENKHLHELGIKENQQVVISKRLGTPCPPTSQSIDWSRQFVGDLLFGQTSNQEQKAYTVAKLVNVTQGYQLLPILLERRVIQNVMALYLQDQRARAHEAELIQLLEMEKKGRCEEDEKKKKKKQKKKEKEKRRKEQSTAVESNGSTATPSLSSASEVESSNTRSQAKEHMTEHASSAPSTVSSTKQKSTGNKSQEAKSTPTTAAATQASCASCNATLEKSHRFCWKCGVATHNGSEESAEVAEPVPTTEPGVSRRRRRKNKKANADASESKSQPGQATIQGATEKQPETRGARVLSAETDEDSGGSPADFSMFDEVYRQVRSYSRDSSIDGFLGGAALPRDPNKSTSRLPFFKQLT